MLREIKHVKQERGPGRRRWFESEGLDLVVWLDARNQVVGFQLCYDVGRGEHALTWREGTGFDHSIVDSGDETPLKNETPVLRPGGPVPWRKIRDLFAERSETLDVALRQLVSRTIAGSGRTVEES